MKTSLTDTFKAMVVGVIIILSTGCSTLQSIKVRHQHAEDIASRAQFERKVIQTEQFLLTTWQRGSAVPKGRLQVYIEGDGNAWERRYRLSKNPTPKNPLGLKLAARDSAEAVLYIARPCMYLAEQDVSACDPRYWSSHRYAEQVIASLDRAIDIAIQDRKDLQITLIGYSGGGTVAALVAARRDDVTSLITIAANLDHEAWTTHHEISPLSGSLNPINYAAELSDVEQTHLLGQEDTIVPRSVIDSYLSHIGTGKPSNLHMIDGYDHSCCWEEGWPGLLNSL